MLIAISSCRKDFETISSYGKLAFSKDTVFLDTVFSNIGSATYNLKVYNLSGWIKSLLTSNQYFLYGQPSHNSHKPYLFEQLPQPCVLQHDAQSLT